MTTNPIIRSALLCLSAFALSACAVTPESATTSAAPAADTQPVETASVSPETRMICRSYDSTGSRLKKEKVCMTEKDWTAKEEEARGFMDGVERDNSTGVGGQSLQTGGN